MFDCAVLQPGETSKRVVLYTVDDQIPEDDETLLVYIVPQTEGVRVAQPSLDNARKGYAVITIRRNDYWSGWIGFYAANSTTVTVNEDSGVPARLTIERRNASFGDLTVRFRVNICLRITVLTFLSIERKQ